MNQTHSLILALALCSCGDPSGTPSDGPTELKQVAGFDGETATDEADGLEATAAQGDGLEATGAEATGAEATAAEATAGQGDGLEATGTEATAAEATGAEAIAAEGPAPVDAVSAVLAAGPRFTRYIALGDSFSSGNGAFGGWYPCYRTEGAWPVLFAKAVNVSRFDHLACSGNTSAEVIRDQLPQLQDADEQTLITVTVGGNDSGFPSWFGKKCVLGQCQNDQATVDEGIGKAFAGLSELFRRLREAAPKSKIVAVGYPHFVEDEDCGTTISKAEAKLIRSAIDRMNDVIAELAILNEISSITTEVTREFSTHGLCGTPPYINVLTWEPAGSYHPNVEGNKAYLTAVANGLTSIL